MVTALVIGVIVALLVAAAWWIAQPKLGAEHRDADEPLPLFSSRVDDGSAGARQHPSIEPPEVAMLRRGTPARPMAPVEARLARAPLAPHDENGTSDARALRPAPTRDGTSLTPTAPRDAVVAGLSPQARAREAQAGPPDATHLGQPPLGLAVPPPAGTVQFLPGRLEVLQGAPVAGQELRFIRPDDPAEQPTVTFGRGDGAPYRHVQLLAPTVSRMHARLTMQPGGTWTLENLSTTNPVVLNGTQLANGSEPRPLADGDRIEMGEVVFRYRQR